MTSLNAQVTSLEAQVTSLEAEVTSLEAEGSQLREAAEAKEATLERIRDVFGDKTKPEVVCTVRLAIGFLLVLSKWCAQWRLAIGF